MVVPSTQFTTVLPTLIGTPNDPIDPAVATDGRLMASAIDSKEGRGV